MTKEKPRQPIDRRAAEPRPAKRAERGVYKGPERRTSTAPWFGRERRKAA